MLKELIAINKSTPLNILMQEKITQTLVANSEYKNSEIERLLTLNERLISQKLKTRHYQLSVKFSDLH